MRGLNVFLVHLREVTQRGGYAGCEPGEEQSFRTNTTQALTGALCGWALSRSSCREILRAETRAALARADHGGFPKGLR